MGLALASPADSSWLLLKRRWVRVENRGRRIISWLNKATVELPGRNKEDEGRSLSTEVTSGTH